jgi:hypothetical protein
MTVDTACTITAAPAFDPGNGSSWPLWLPWTIESAAVGGLIAITLIAAARAAARWVKRRHHARR